MTGGRLHAAVRRRHGALFWRIYLHGVVLLLLVALAVAVVGWALRGERLRDPAPIAIYVAWRAAELVNDPPRLGAELHRVRDAFGIDATVYRPDGAVVTSTADPPLPLEPRQPFGPVHARRIELPDGRGRVVVSGPHARDPRHGLIFIAAVLGALALASVPFARSISAPIERLTEAARALGEGDLSARAGVRAHGEVGALARAFDDMAARVETLVRTEKELLANVSHEIRTPLARIRVALELAAEGDLARARRYLGEIGADVEDLDHLVEDVLAAARLDLASTGARPVGAWPVRREPVDLAAVVREAAERFRAAHPGRALDVTLAPALPALRGDAPLLRRAIENLLDNAAKYSEAPAPVALTASAAAGLATVEVRDRGIGVEAEDLPRLFTPFFRTDRSRARGTGGVGLGLALARRIAEAHGGTVEAESVPGEGTTVRVHLPAAPA